MEKIEKITQKSQHRNQRVTGGMYDYKELYVYRILRMKTKPVETKRPTPDYAISVRV